MFIGNSMAFPGVAAAKDRADLIAYLKANSS
jgi:cytochrome c2